MAEGFLKVSGDSQRTVDVKSLVQAFFDLVREGVIVYQQQPTLPLYQAALVLVCLLIIGAAPNLVQLLVHQLDDVVVAEYLHGVWLVFQKVAKTGI